MVFRSSHWRYSIRKVPKAWNFIKKRLQHKCFPVKNITSPVFLGFFHSTPSVTEN